MQDKVLAQLNHFVSAEPLMQYQGAVIKANGKEIEHPDAAGVPDDGVCRDSVSTAGEANVIQIDGVVFVKIGADVIAGDEAMLLAGGLYATAVSGSVRVGRFLQNGANGSLVRMLKYRPAQNRRSTRGANVASAATIAVIAAADWFHVTGAAAIVNITVPNGFQSGESIRIIPDGLFTWTAAGNIAVAGAAAVGRVLTFMYDATTTKWYPSYI